MSVTLPASAPESLGARDALRTLAKDTLLGRVLLKEVVLATGTNKVRHGLGRIPEGAVVVRKSAAVDLYDEVPTSPKLEWWINASGAATIDLLVF